MIARTISVVYSFWRTLQLLLPEEMDMTASELMERVLVEAQTRSLSTQRVVLVFNNRVKMLSKTRLIINGFHCRLHQLENVRVDKDMHYAMFGVTRSSLRRSDFLIVLLHPQGSEERFLIVPSKVVLNHVPKGTRTKRFYIPLHPPTQRKTWQAPCINWLHYQDRWKQLEAPLSSQNASAIG